MNVSQEGIDLIKKYEGCHLAAYKCPAGVWTIGYGHTRNVKEGDVITQAQADAYLLEDLKKSEDAVNDYYSKYKWSQNEFDALVSFAYNIGNIKQLIAYGTRSRQVIAEKMLQYNKAGGKVLNGLVKRRQDEQALFLKGSAGTVEATGIVEYSLAKDGNKQISQNFKVKEFRCKDGSDKILIDTDFVRDKLQAIRDHFGAAVTINSAYRTATYNKKVGGASGSYHLKGQAFDIVVKGHTPAEVAKYAYQIGVPGIIQYNTFVHVDSRKGKYYARNDNGKITKLNSFT